MGVELAGDRTHALEVRSAALEPREFFGEIPQRPARGAHLAGEPGRIVTAILQRELGQHACAHE